MLNTSRHRGVERCRLHVLSIAASVTRLKWRPPANEKFVLDQEDRHDSMLAVATASIKGASAGGQGLIALWSYNRAYMPLSVVEGHKEGSVTDFAWLETPQSSDEPDIGARGKNTRVKQSTNALEYMRGNTKVGESLDQHRLPTRPFDTEFGPRESHDASEKTVGIWQHTISVGRDGRCLIQSFVRGTLRKTVIILSWNVALKNSLRR
jgi:WD repeat-containing protein 24